MFGRKRNDEDEAKAEAERGPEDLVAPLAKPPSRPSMLPPQVSRPPVLPPRLNAAETIPASAPASPLPTASTAGVAQTAASKPPAEPFRRIPETPAAAPEKPMRQLIVGRDISLSGEINSCDRLVVDGNVDAKGTRKQAEAYLQYLYTPEAQAIIARNFFRPAHPEFADKADLARFHKIELITVADTFGGWKKAQATHFADGGVFDQIYQH